MEKSNGRNETPSRPYRQTGARSHGVGFAVVQVDSTGATLKPVIRHAQNGAEDQVAHETRQGLPGSGDVPVDAQSHAHQERHQCEGPQDPPREAVCESRTHAASVTADRRQRRVGASDRGADYHVDDEPDPRRWNPHHIPDHGEHPHHRHQGPEHHAARQSAVDTVFDTCRIHGSNLPLKASYAVRVIRLLFVAF